MIEVKQPEIPQEVHEQLIKILEINSQIVRQNALIVQSITLPTLIIKGNSHNE